MQQLVSEVSSDFINLAADEIDQHVKEALGKLAAFLGFNGAALTKFAACGTSAAVTHIWAAPELQFSRRLGRKITKIPRNAMERLQHYHWPGNVRQLRNIIEHSVIVGAGVTLKLAMAEEGVLRTANPATLAEHEREHIVGKLELSGWRIKGPTGAAQKLGLKPSTLYTRMKKLRIPTRGERLETKT